MPEKLVVDGQEREFFTAEDIEATKKSAAEEAKKAFEEQKRELEEMANPNWKAARSKMKDLETKLSALESQGKTLNDKGEVVDLDKKITSEEVSTQARLSARQELLSVEKERFLSRFDNDGKKTVEFYYNKLTAGEDVNFSNMAKFMDDAQRLAFPGVNNSDNNVIASLGSSSHTVDMSGKKEDFSETDAGGELANRLGLKIK